MRDLVALPKTDLHVHLEGTMRPPTLVEIAARHGMDVPEALRDGRWVFESFLHFIKVFPQAYFCLQEPGDLRRIAYEMCEDEAAEGVRYAEVTYALAGHAVRMEDWDSPLDAVLEGLAEGERDFGVRTRLVLDVIRGIPKEISERTVEAALKYRDRGVIAVGLGGDETHPPEPYADMFRAARDGGLRSLPHAGEFAGPASVRGAIDVLGAERIGHGFRILEDPDLVDEVRERGIPLEVCPTSNVATQVVPSLPEHPLPRLLGAGLTVTLNSDDPAMFRSPLAGEYEVARKIFGLDDAALAGLARAGVGASFADDDLKRSLFRDIDRWEDGS